MRCRKAGGPASSSHGLLALALLSSATLGGSAFAAPKLQGIGETSIGYTDNIQSAPEVPLPGGTPKSSGVFLVLSPGVVLASATQSAIHRLSYQYTYDLFLQRTNASTSSNRLDYRGFFDLSPRLGLVLGAAAAQSNQYSAIIITPPGAGAVNALPPGSGAFLSATGDEALSYDLAPGWRGYEGASVSEQTPLFDTVAPRTFAPAGRIGVERSFRVDALGVEGRTEYSVVEGSLRPDGTALGTQRQLIFTGLGRWRRDFGRAFTSRLEAGALRVERLNTGRGFWEPTGTAALAYVTEVGDAELAYAHTVTTNLLLGQTLLVDEVRLRGAVPLTKKGEVLIAASSGYQRGRLLDENAALAAHVNSILADVGIGWQVTASLLLGLRYQHFEQMSDTTKPPLPLSFVRNSVMVGATFKFPPESEMPRAYRAPRRVDRSDEIRDAVEPAGAGGHERSGGQGT
ncbi:MAG TPA: hypothetical protein VF395_18600 [Polyangiaceae bacterium]